MIAKIKPIPLSIDEPTPKCSLLLYKESIRLDFENITFPSTSNNREIGYRWTFRDGQRVKVPFLMKNKQQLKALETISQLYGIALMENHMLVSPSLTGKVTVLVLLAKKGGRWDSHNASKSIGDWLEDVGIIENDTDAEILCFKKAEYFETANTTTIYIGPRTYFDLQIRRLINLIPGKQ